MTEIIQDFLNNLISGAFASFDSLMISLLGNMLFVEKLFSNALSIDAIAKAYNYIYMFSCSLVGLKFLTKGFKIYILWRDGDADSSLQDMLIGVGQASVVMAGFPYVYGMLASATEMLSNGIMTNFGFNSVSGAFDISMFLSTGLFEIIILLIYVILVLVLCITLIKRGGELMVLRLGVPFAALGLLDSDFGAFKGYMQTLMKTLLTAVVQITLLSLSIRVMTSFSVVNLICGIAIISTAFSTPALLQSMLIPTGSTNVINKVYSGARLASTAKSLLGK